MRSIASSRYRDILSETVAQARSSPCLDFLNISRESLALFLNGEPETARLTLRDLVNLTVGFETLAHQTDKNGKSLHRMLSGGGNSTMDNLAAIFDAVRGALRVRMQVSVVRARGPLANLTQPRR